MTIDICQIENKEQWLAWRRQDVTASDVPVLAGYSQYKTPLRVWAEKAGVVDDPAETRAMTRGRWMEASVLEALRETQPRWQIERASVYIRDPELRLGCTPDAFATAPIREDGDLTERVVVEAKTVARPMFEQWDGDAPPAYRIQALVQCMLTGAARAVIPVLVIDAWGCDLHVFHVERNEAAEEEIRALVRQFWADVEAGREPKARKGDLALVKTLYPSKDGKEPLDLSGDNHLPEALNIRAESKGRIKELEALVEEIDAEIIAKLNGASVGILPGWKISNPLIHSKERIQKAYDYTRLTVSKTREDK